MLYRFQLTYGEIIDILDLKYILTKRKGFSLNAGMFEITKINKTIDFILTDNVRVIFTIDDIRLKSNLNFNQTLIFTKCMNIIKNKIMYDYTLCMVSFIFWLWLIFLNPLRSLSSDVKFCFDCYKS